MLNDKKLFCLSVFIIFLSFHFVSAEITIPSIVERGDTVDIKIDLDVYFPYARIYDSDERSIRSLNLGCEARICTNRTTIKYAFTNFESGVYDFKIYSYDDNDWVSKEFEIIQGPCSDETPVEECSQVTIGKYCNANGDLIDNWASCIPDLEITIDSQIERGTTSSIRVNFEGEYAKYMNIVNPEGGIINQFSLPCNSSRCTGEASVDYDFPYLELGFYNFSVYSYNHRRYISKEFEIIQGPCSDETPVEECSQVTIGKYCNTNSELINGELIDDCSTCGCSFGDVCFDDGGCRADIPVAANKKTGDSYTEREVFLVSDKDWKDVLPFVPVTVWTDDENCGPGTTSYSNFLTGKWGWSWSSAVDDFSNFWSDLGDFFAGVGDTGEGPEGCIYPTLIYYDDSHGFDMDSIVDFIQKYPTSRVTIIGETENEIDDLLIAAPSFGAGLSSDKIKRVNGDDYLSYWQSFDETVYVEDDYELALLASTYASLLNAPLIIEGTSNDDQVVFSGRKVICVGNVVPSGRSCDEEYDLEQLQEKYKAETNTNKIILINPLDWDVSVSQGFNPEKSIYPIFNLYKRLSLVSPFLASAKHELILSIKDNRSSEIDEFLESELEGMDYLTIFASGIVIPHKKDRDDVETRIFEFVMGEEFVVWALDSSHYVDISGDNEPDLAVGRIAGISNSDVSSLVARSIFYNRFPKTNNVKFLASSFDGRFANQMVGTVNIFEQYSDYNVDSHLVEAESYDFDPSEWENQDMIFYFDHGSEDWSGIDNYEIPVLNNTLAISYSCLTASTYNRSSFWAHAIRKGAIGYFGNTGIAANMAKSGTVFHDLLNKIYHEDSPTIGIAAKDTYDPSPLSSMATFIGDPTLDINPKHLSQEVSTGICWGDGDLCGLVGDCCEGLACNFGTCKECLASGTHVNLLNMDMCCNGHDSIYYTYAKTCCWVDWLNSGCGNNADRCGTFQWFDHYECK